MTRQTRAPASLAALVAVGACVLAACGGGSGNATTDLGHGDGDQRPTGDETAASPADLAMDAYQESWDATFRALDPPAETPELAELLTGEALLELQANIDRWATEGHRIEGSVRTHPTVVSATAGKVVLDDCAVENSAEYDAAGQVVDPPGDVSYNFRVTVVNEDGTWKVSQFERREDPCTAG